MGKKQREERKTSVQLEPRRPSVGTTTSATLALADRPTSRVTIGQIVENSRDIEQHLPDSGSYFENIRIDPEGSAVVSPLYSHFADGELFSRRDSSEKGTRPPAPDSEEADSRRKSKRWAYKNVYGLSLAYVVLFTAFIGLQNLQSSINSAGGLGLATLSIVYAMFIAAGFITPAFLKLFGTKYSLLFGFICHLIYTLTNYYPSWYTLVPASILIGFALGPLWAAASTHLAEVAVMVAPSLGKKQDYLISKFTGLFFFFFQFSQVPGNLASSLILFPYTKDDVIDSGVNLNISNESSEESESGGTCNILTSQSFDVTYLYILVSVYVGFIVTGIVLLLVFVDRLPSNNSFFSAEKKLELYLKEPLIELLKVLKDVKMLLIAPMVVYNGMELAFAFGTFTEVYISQCFGTYQVGFTLIALGVSSAIMSIICSRLLKYIPRFAIMLFGIALSGSMLLFMLFWERVPSYAVIFTIAVGWGTADAVWNTMPTSLTGILFSSRSDVAYSAMRIWQGVGFTIGFVIAELLSFHHRVWVLLATVSVAAVVNVILEFTTQSKEELFPCVYRRRHRKSCDNSEPSSVEGSNTSSPNLDIKKEPAMDDGELACRDRTTNINCSVGQNPMFIMYGGRRPSTMSTWSADSLDGTLPSNSTDYATLAPTVNNSGDGMLLLQQNGQNPLFVMYNGRRPSTESINSYRSSERGDRRPSGVSAIYAADSLDGTLPQIASSGSNPSPPHCETTTPCTNYPPLVVTTVPYVGSDAPVRVLSPIHECEDDDSEGENPAITKDSRTSSGTIQRTNSYMAALDDAVSMEYSHC